MADGRLGCASGRGFYRYHSDGTSIPDVEVPLVAPLAAAAIVERLELAVVNEAYRAVADGLAAPSVIDEALRLDAGFPRGPFEIVDELGLRHVVERLQRPARDRRRAVGRPVPSSPSSCGRWPPCDAPRASIA